MISRFRYKATRPNGKSVRGTIQAASQADAERLLWDNQLTILSLRPERASPPLDEQLPSVFGVRRTDLITFSDQFATLLSSGVPILQALALLAEQTNRRPLRRALEGARVDLQEGVSLSTAMAKAPLVFPRMYVQMVAIGEQTGSLDTVLHKLAETLTKEEAAIGKLRQGLGYPSFVLALATVVVFILLNFVLPSMSALFNALGADLPLPTRILIAVGNWSSVWAMPTFLALAISVGAVFWYRTKPAGRLVTDNLLIRLPLLGSFVLKSDVARLSNSISLMLSAGVGLTDTLDLAASVATLTPVQQALKTIQREVLSGEAISAALARHAIFPKLAVQLARIGEETGTLDRSLGTVARYYEQETDRLSGRILGMIEPTMILGIGLVVGFVAVAIITPIYSISQTLR